MEGDDAIYYQIYLSIIIKIIFFYEFYSSINDILDKEHFILEELLQEDDLLQEIKSKNDRLVEL